MMSKQNKGAAETVAPASEEVAAVEAAAPVAVEPRRLVVSQLGSISHGPRLLLPGAPADILPADIAEQLLAKGLLEWVSETTQPETSAASAETLTASVSPSN